VIGPGRRHHLAGDRADDRQDHDRQDQPGRSSWGISRAAADEGNERRRSANHWSALQLGREKRRSPQPVDDRRHGRPTARPARSTPSAGATGTAPWRTGRCDGDRHADQQRESGGDQRADDERQGAEFFAADVPVVAEHEAETTPEWQTPGCASPTRRTKKNTIKREDQPGERRSGRTFSARSGSRAKRRPPRKSSGRRLHCCGAHWPLVYPIGGYCVVLSRRSASRCIPGRRRPSWTSPGSNAGSAA